MDDSLRTVVSPPTAVRLWLQHKAASSVGIIWLATREKGLSDICVNCRLGSACAVRAG